MDADYIPYGRQSISDDDIAAVVDVLQSDFLTMGPKVPAFERAVAAYCGAAHGIAVNSATSALHIACLALGVGPGDRVWTSPNTFVASANCARYCGAEVDFVDIDPETYTLSAAALAAKLEKAAVAGQLPKAVIPVHFAGQSCDMEAIGQLSRDYGFRIIEDAAHAIGARYRGEPVGNCHHSDITVFSLHPVKIITTGEGGMAVTNDPALARRMTLLRSHGITREPAEMESRSEGPWYYEQTGLGFNYRMSDIQAALGLSQLDRLNAFVARRRELAARYDGKLAALPVVLPRQASDGRSAFHLYPIRVDSEQTRKPRREIFESLLSKGIGVNVHYIPVYTQPDFRRLGFKPGLCPQAERYYAEAISLPLYAGLTDEQQNRVIRALKQALA